MTVLETQYFPNGATDVSSALTKAKGAQSRRHHRLGPPCRGVAIVKQAKELGVKPRGFGETVAPPTPDFAKTLGPLAEGVLGSSQWTKSPRVRTSTSALRRSTTTTSSPGSATRGVPRRGGHGGLPGPVLWPPRRPVRTEPDKVRDALAALDTDSFFGRINFDSNGQNTYKPMAVIQIQNGTADRVAEGLGRGPDGLAGHRVVSSLRPGHLYGLLQGGLLALSRRRLLAGLGRDERRQPRSWCVRRPRRVHRLPARLVRARPVPRMFVSAAVLFALRLRGATPAHQPRGQRADLHHAAVDVRLGAAAGPRHEPVLHRQLPEHRPRMRELACPSGRFRCPWGGCSPSA